MNIRQAVVFSILMEGNLGALDKHPNYLWEKLNLCQKLSVPEVLLDPFNFQKFLSYRNKYGFKWEPQHDSTYVPRNCFDPVTGSATKEGLKVAEQRKNLDSE